LGCRRFDDICTSIVSGSGTAFSQYTGDEHNEQPNRDMSLADAERRGTGHWESPKHKKHGQTKGDTYRKSAAQEREQLQ